MKSPVEVLPFVSSTVTFRGVNAGATGPRDVGNNGPNDEKKEDGIPAVGTECRGWVRSVRYGAAFVRRAVRAWALFPQSSMTVRQTRGHERSGFGEKMRCPT